MMGASPAGRAPGRLDHSAPASTILFILALAGLLAFPAAGLGQASADRPRGWADLGAGGGRVRLGESPRESAFALDFSGGVWLGRRIGLGLRLGGLTIEGFDLWNPEEGESLSELFAVLAFHPGPDHPLSLALESGRVSYTVNDPSRMLEEGDGLGWRVAGSWRFPVSDHVAFSPSLFRSWGKIDPDTGGGEGFEYTATGISLRVGWEW